jgi:hypothetical protein
MFLLGLPLGFLIAGKKRDLKNSIDELQSLNKQIMRYFSSSTCSSVV